MDRAKPTICLFPSFALLAGIASAYEYDPSLRPCEKDECYVETHADDPWYECRIQGHSQNILYPIDGTFDEYNVRIPSGCWRSNIFDGAYPSTGGVVFLRDPSAVDLQYLGLPNTHDTARSPDEDDDLATRMVQLGAQWWPNWDLYFRHWSMAHWLGVFYNYHFPSNVHVAFPTTGGVWVANFTGDSPRSSPEDEVCEPWLPRTPWSWRSKMRYALTMDDKSEMMKDMGATFYNSVDEVPGLAKTVDEAASLFEPFKERLKKMEDYNYRQRVCTYLDENKNTANKKPEKSRWGIGWLFNELR